MQQGTMYWRLPGHVWVRGYWQYFAVACGSSGSGHSGYRRAYRHPAISLSVAAWRTVAARKNPGRNAGLWEPAGTRYHGAGESVLPASGVGQLTAGLLWRWRFSAGRQHAARRRFFLAGNERRAEGRWGSACGRYPARLYDGTGLLHRAEACETATRQPMCHVQV